MSNEPGHPDDLTDPADANEALDEPDSEVLIVERQRHPAARQRAGQLQVRQRAGLPAPVAKVAVAVAAGAALQIGVGLAGKYLAYRAGKSAAQSVGARALKARPNNHQQPVQKVEEPADERGTVISETLIVRRVWFRRDRE